MCSNRPTYDEGANECTHEMGKSNNRCLTKNEENTYLETYNCEYIKSPKPSRFARAMVRIASFFVYWYSHFGLSSYTETIFHCKLSEYVPVAFFRNNYTAQTLYCHTLYIIPQSL